MTRRTFIIGDIHGDSAALDRLLLRLPLLDSDTLVFLGDYVDRGPDSAGVVDRVRRLAAGAPENVVTLRGNHEDKWVQSARKPDLPFLVQSANGCAHTYRSFVGGAVLSPDESLPTEELQRMLTVDWLPAEVVAWMDTLPLWYEDEHAMYVHAGLEGEEGAWKHPRDSQPKPLMWMREPKFFKTNTVKRVVFGHTPVAELPIADDRPPTERELPWVTRHLVGLDTGSGKGGYLSAIELPSGTLHDSR